MGTCAAIVACGDAFVAGAPDAQVVSIPDSSGDQTSGQDSTFGDAVGSNDAPAVGDGTQGVDARPPVDAGIDAPAPPPPVDAGEDVGIPDSSTCTSGEPCDPPDAACLTGTTSCATGVMVCDPTGQVSNGTSCNGAVPYSACENGQCEIQDACTAEIPNSGEAFVAVGGTGGGGGGSPSGMCTMAVPCGSVTVALANLGSRTKIYVEEGTYTESFALPVGVTIQGGWLDNAGTWTRDCSPTAASSTTIKSDGTQTWTIQYPKLPGSSSGTSTLDTLTVESTGLASPAAGSSVYGIFVSGSGAGTVLNLQNVDVSAGAATAGAQGGMGSMGTAAPAAGSCTCASPDAGTGATGANGTTTGAAGGAGIYSASGYTPATPGGAAPGAAGQSGGDGAEAPTPKPYGYEVDTCDSSGNGTCDLGTPDTGSAGQGSCGCGGGGGGGGATGGGGGSSVGLYVSSATVTVTGGTLASGTGGTGGAGGGGGPGAPASPPSTGVTGPASCTCIVKTVGGNPTCRQMCGTGEPGTTGGVAGSGGTGAQGGGGRGGDSYAYYALGGIPVTTTSVTITPGAAGAGGSPNASNAGTSAPHN